MPEIDTVSGSVVVIFGDLVVDVQPNRRRNNGFGVRRVFSTVAAAEKKRRKKKLHFDSIHYLQQEHLKDIRMRIKTKTRKQQSRLYSFPFRVYPKIFGKKKCVVGLKYA